MSEIVYETTFSPHKDLRSILIRKLRGTLNAAEQGEEVVTFEFGGVELHIDFPSGELLVTA